MSHKYKHKGFVKPSVTTIISDCNDKSGALTQWAANMACEWIRANCEQPWFDKTGNESAVEPNITASSDCYIVFPDELDLAAKNFRDVSKDALEIGSEVHASIEEWLKTGREPINPREEVLSAFIAFLEFFDAHKMRTIKIEHKVYGDYWGGMLDWYGEYDGKLYVWDWKTSKHHYPNEHGPQIAAYRSRVNAKVEGCGVLRIDKTTGYPDPKDYSKRYLKDLEHFNLMVPLYLHRHPRIAKAAGFQPPF